MKPPDRLAHLSPEQRALLLKNLAQRKAAGSEDASLRRRKQGEPRVLSFAQQRLWFLDQMSPGTAVYNVPFYVRIRGELQVEALRQAVNGVVQRHDALRTVIITRNGEPVPLPVANRAVPFPYTDLRDLPRAAREARALELLREDAARPFQLNRDLMLRTQLIRLDDQEYLFLHVTHHIAWDLQSREILYNELRQLYEACITGRPAELPELPIEYGDYALWQRRRLAGARLDELVSFWKQQLGDAPRQLNLPTDHPRPPVQSLRGAKVPAVLPAELLAQLRQLSGHLGATPFMTVLAAFGVLLYCWSGQPDLCIGSPMLGRHDPATERLIGFFINTVVLRLRMHGQATFRELVQRARETTMDVLAHQDLPFDKIVEAISPPRDLSRMPLFQVNLRVQAGAAKQLELPGLETDPSIFLDSGTSKFDVGLEVPSTAGAVGFWEFSTDLFEATTIQRLGHDFERVLGALLAAPDQPLANLDVICEFLEFDGTVARRVVAVSPATPASGGNSPSARPIFPRQRIRRAT